MARGKLAASPRSTPRTDTTSIDAPSATTGTTQREKGNPMQIDWTEVLAAVAAAAAAAAARALAESLSERA